MNNVRALKSMSISIAVFAIWLIFGCTSTEEAEPASAPTEVASTSAEEAAPDPVDRESLDQQLIAAVFGQDVAAVTRLLDAGANPNAFDSSGDPILKSVTVLGNEGAVELLIAHGADVNVVDSDNNHLLPLATERGHLGIVELMLDAGADVDAKSSTGYIGTWLTAMDQTALLLAAKNNSIEMVELLIASGADVEYAEITDGRTALHFAAYENNPEIITILLASGADPDRRSRWQGAWTPLHLAMSRAALEAVQALVQGGANVDLGTDPWGRTPLMQAITENMNKRRRSELVTILLDGGADPNIQDELGLTALHHAATEARVEILPMLIEHGADADLETNRGKTALELAPSDLVTEALLAAIAGD